MAARVSTSVRSLACVSPQMGLEGLFAREGTFAESASYGALRLSALLDERRDLLELWSTSTLSILHDDIEFHDVKRLVWGEGREVARS